jgi:hypothetical protein
MRNQAVEVNKLSVCAIERIMILATLMTHFSNQTTHCNGNGNGGGKSMLSEITSHCSAAKSHKTISDHNAEVSRSSFSRLLGAWRSPKLVVLCDLKAARDEINSVFEPKAKDF